MKKKMVILLSILIVLLLVSAALVTNYIDSARVRNSVEPKCTIKIVSENENKVTYWGLGYKVIRYPSVSPLEPYKNNRGVKYGNWFMKYELSGESTDKTTEIENVSISISDITSTGATVIIKDLNEKPFVYGEWYKIEKEINGKWYDVEPIIDNYGFNEMGYLTNENGEVKFVIDWKWLYGELQPGKYRLLKQVDNSYIYVEFHI